MPGLANVFMSDIACQINGGVNPQALASGTTSGNAIQLGGLSPFGKLLFKAVFSMTASSASGTISMYLGTATASNGTFTSISQTLTSMAFTSASSTKQLVLQLDTRNEAFANLATGSAAPAWVQPVIVLATSTVNLYLDVLGWCGGVDPEKNFLGTNVAISEVDFY